jgi:hypothetical protein
VSFIGNHLPSLTYVLLGEDNLRPRFESVTEKIKAEVMFGEAYVVDVYDKIEVFWNGTVGKEKLTKKKLASVSPFLFYSE